MKIEVTNNEVKPKRNGKSKSVHSAKSSKAVKTKRPKSASKRNKPNATKKTQKNPPITSRKKKNKLAKKQETTKKSRASNTRDELITAPKTPETLSEPKKDVNQPAGQESEQAVDQAEPQLTPEIKSTPISPVKATVKSSKRQKPSQIAAPKSIQINIALPKLPATPVYNRIRSKLPSTSRRTVVGLFVVGIISFVSLHRLQLLPGQNKGDASLVSEVIESKPEHETILPAGKDVRSLGGWKRVSPQGAEPVHAYADKIGSVQITVSEQLLPADFKDNTDAKLEELAKNFNATEKVTAGEVTLYIGSSTDGPQSVILAKKGLLILMKSASPVTKEQWTEYVNFLQ